MRILIATILMVLSSTVCANSAARAEQDAEMSMAIGGNGGVYFLPDRGELIVDVEKRDLNLNSAKTELRAILVGPDRRIIKDVAIPDDGNGRKDGMGPVQRIRFKVNVKSKGVYALNVTTSTDRYGQKIVWGFSTNCEQYLIETARGHKDERHLEPIVLAQPAKAMDVCFMPRKGRLAIQVDSLPQSTKALTSHDGKDQLIATLPVEQGKASHAVGADAHARTGVWRLHLPQGKGVVQIDGVTRWEKSDLCPNIALWTPRRSSFFPLAEYRWLLTPYCHRVFGEAGSEGTKTFFVHNNSRSQATIDLAVEFPDTCWPVHLLTNRVTLSPNDREEVVVRYTVPAEGETKTCHVRVTPLESEGFATYSSLEVTAGHPLATRPLELPLMLKPYRHENEQFGYSPKYPLESQVYFDPNDTPFVRTGDGVASRRDGRWSYCDFNDRVTWSDGSKVDGRFSACSTKVAFDSQGDVYVLAEMRREKLLLHSSDHGESFTAYRIKERGQASGSLDIEQFAGANTPSQPPAIIRFTRTASDPKRIWRRINDLELILPQKTDGGLEIGEPILVSRKCIGLSSHSGIPNSVVSRDEKVHLVWAEATDPNVDVPGVPTFVATFDRATNTLGKPVLIGYGPPPNDIHNSPSITIDNRGYLHVLVGTHGRPFPYSRSLQPNTANEGWTEPNTLGDNLNQTYVGFVCGPDDTLHAVFRLWRSGAEPYPLSHFGTLAYQRKRPGKSWEPPRILVVPPFSEYSVYYHRLTIDRRGRLFLSYDYWSTYWFYRNDHLGDRRALLTSPDGGTTWKLAEDQDL